MIERNTEFECAYKVTIAKPDENSVSPIRFSDPNPPELSRLVQLEQAASNHFRGPGVIFETATGEQWTGEFEGLSAIYNTPRPECVLVICGETGYLVDLSKPGEYSVLPNDPILAVHVGAGSAAIIVHDYTNISCIDHRGIGWSSERISWDGFKNISLAGRQLSGQCWHAPLGQFEPFTIELDTGAVSGNIYDMD